MSSIVPPAGQELSDRTDREGNGGLRFTSATVTSHPSGAAVVRMGDDVKIDLEYVSAAPLGAVNITILIQDEADQIILRVGTREMCGPIRQLQGRGVITCLIPALPLLPGRYHLFLAASAPPLYDYFDYIGNACSFDVVEADVYGTGRIPDSGYMFVNCQWLVAALDNEVQPC